MFLTLGTDCIYVEKDDADHVTTSTDACSGANKYVCLNSKEMLWRYIVNFTSFLSSLGIQLQFLQDYNNTFL